MNNSGLKTRGTQQESVKKHDVCSRSTMCFWFVGFYGPSFLETHPCQVVWNFPNCRSLFSPYPVIEAEPGLRSMRLGWCQREGCGEEGLSRDTMYIPDCGNLLEVTRIFHDTKWESTQFWFGRFLIGRGKTEEFHLEFAPTKTASFFSVLKLLREIFYFPIVPSLKLTARTWKWVVGILVSFSGWPVFRGYIRFRECITQFLPNRTVRFAARPWNRWPTVWRTWRCSWTSILAGEVLWNSWRWLTCKLKGQQMTRGSWWCFVFSCFWLLLARRKQPHDGWHDLNDCFVRIFIFIYIYI